jgi:hypothetical protein
VRNRFLCIAFECGIHSVYQARRRVSILTIQRLAVPLIACLLLAVVACGGGRTEGDRTPTSPSSQIPTATTGWMVNSDSASPHAARYVAADGSALDVWNVGGTGSIGTVRVRAASGSTFVIELDDAGRLRHIQDRAGTQLWVNAYLGGNSVDVTIARSGQMWRGTVEAAGPVIVSRQPSLFRPMVSANELAQLGGAFCDSRIVDAIDAILLGICFYTAASSVVSPVTGVPAALLSCIGRELIFLAFEESACAFIREAARAAANQEQLRTGALGEPQSPAVPPPTIPISSPSPQSRFLRAVVDGVPFTATVTAAATVSGGNLFVLALNATGPGIEFVLSPGAAGACARTATADTNNQFRYRESDQVVWSTIVGGSGIVRLTTCTQTRVAGTFSFVAGPIRGSVRTVNVTQGVFDMPRRQELILEPTN